MEGVIRYETPLKLAHDLLRVIRRDTTKNTEDFRDLPTGLFQFSTPDKSGKHTTRSIEGIENMTELANSILVRSLQRPINRVNSDGKIQQIQAFTGSSNLPSIDTGQAWTSFVDERSYDVNYRPLFRMVDLKPGTLDFTIATGKRGAKMEKIPEGGQVDIAGFSGDKLVVTCEKYGLAFAITYEMLEGNDFNAFKDEFLNYESELYGTWADVHYAVLRTCADDDSNDVVAYNTTGTDVLEKDVNTINAARTALFEQLKDKFGNGVNAKLYIVADIALEARIRRAIKTTTNLYDKVQLLGNIEPLFTTNENIRLDGASDADAPFEPLLVFPMQKLQDAVKVSNLELTEKDIRSLADITAGWTVFGVGAGEVLQVKRMEMHTA